MQPVLAFAFLFGLPAGAYGTECGAGWKHKASLVGLTCATQTTDVASCSSECCEKNTATCGGLEGISCPWDQYAAGDDAWKNKAATEKTKNIACCQPKVTCANVYIVAPAGRESKGASVQASKCSSDAKSCTEGDLCFKNDVKKCMGWFAVAANAKTCSDLAPKQYASGSDDAWKNKAIGADAKLACCGVVLKCNAAKAAVVCKAGQEKTTADCKALNADPSVCQKEVATCCKADVLKCGGYAAADLCSTGYAGADDSDVWKNKATVADKTQRTKDCCAKVATCASATCTYVNKLSTKKKANSDALACPGNAKSCGTSTTCCETDTGKCGGLTGISCPYGFVDERITWDAGTTKTPQGTKDAWNNKPANATNKNTNCCTPVAVCALPVAVGTTTPAPVVTTTPLVTAMKFSQHKATIEESSDRPWGANMVWLGVGGIIGMSVLMVIQGLRSRMQTVEQYDAREVADQLIDMGSLE